MEEISPTALSKWLGLAYAGAVILFLLRGPDAWDAMLLSLLFLPWAVGPAALAYAGAKFSRSERAAWAFFALEALIVGSTAWLRTYLIVIAPDAQNGVAMMLFSLLQYAVVLLFFVIAVVFGYLKSHKTSKSNFIYQGFAQDVPGGFKITRKGLDFVREYFRN